MSMLAVIDADPHRSRLGLRSRIAERIGAFTVLERTASRLRAASAVDAVAITCAPGDQVGAIGDPRQFG